MTGIIIERPRPEEISAAATALSHALLTQPNLVAVWRRQDERARRAIEKVFKAAKLDRPYANIFVARNNGQIVGAVNMVEWPRCQPSKLETLRLMPRMIMTFKGAMIRAAKIQSAWAKHDPEEHHRHIGPIGVLPELQRQKIGSMLLGKCCEIIDQRKEAAYLETDRPQNVGFYEKFGFIVTGKEEILCVTNWYMWRPPR